jgi:PPM family protein phosphatase
MDELMPIGEFSERSGLSPKRLRNYASAGLLVPAAVDASSGYRYYSPGQLRDAQLIDALRAAGISIRDIGRIIRDPSSQRLDALQTELEADAAQRHGALEAARRLLEVDAPAPGPRPSHDERNAMTSFTAAGRTDVGRTRDNNEDEILTNGHLIAVADGMGGPPGGEVAASIAAAVLESGFSGRSLEELEAVVRAANRAIYEHATATPGLSGMGTTLCAVGLTEGGNLAVVSVGDSRAYLVRDRDMRQLTDDHSVAAELARRGEITEEEAAVHPQRNVLFRVLGVGPTVDAEGTLLPVRPGDRLIVCTDGLHNELTDQDILRLAQANANTQELVDDLVGQALDRGGRDNIAVVAADL